MEKIALVLLSLIFIDSMLLWKKSRKLIGKIFRIEITEREPIAENLMIGLLVGFMVFSFDKGNSMIISSSCFIIGFMIWKGFEYKRQ